MHGKNILFDDQLRDWDMLEKKTFVIGLYHVRSFLANQNDSYSSLQINLCQLRGRLKKLIKEEYFTRKKYKKNIKDAFLVEQCKQYKRFLLFTCLTYYLLAHISQFYDKKDSIQFIKMQKMDPFLHTFFFELAHKLDFDYYEMENFAFNLSLEDKSIIFKYPEKFSFRVVGYIFLLGKGDPFNKLFNATRQLIKNIFSLESFDEYMKSLQTLYFVEKEISGIESID